MNLTNLEVHSLLCEVFGREGENYTRHNRDFSDWSDRMGMTTVYDGYTMKMVVEVNGEREVVNPSATWSQHLVPLPDSIKTKLHKLESIRKLVEGGVFAPNEWYNGLDRYALVIGTYRRESYSLEDVKGGMRFNMASHIEDKGGNIIISSEETIRDRKRNSPIEWVRETAENWSFDQPVLQP